MQSLEHKRENKVSNNRIHLKASLLKVLPVNCCDYLSSAGQQSIKQSTPVLCHKIITKKKKTKKLTMVGTFGQHERR